LNGSVAAKRIGVSLHYYIVSGWLVLMWLIYPIAYGCDEGNEISVTSGFIFYGILDILTVPLLSFAILALATRWDYREMNIYFTQYGRVAQAGGDFPEREKTVTAPAAEQPVVAPENTV
jgi:bacteriorhodopsin